jgi:hypothetical protein
MFLEHILAIFSAHLHAYLRVSLYIAIRLKWLYRNKSCFAGPKLHSMKTPLYGGWGKSQN